MLLGGEGGQEYRGKITGTRWRIYDDNGQKVPYMQVEVAVPGVGENGADQSVTASLFFDGSIDPSTERNPPVKTRMVTSMELLRDYGVKVNVDAPAENRFDEWADAYDPDSGDLIEHGPLVGKEASLFCKVKDGKQRTYLNRPKAPPANAQDVHDAFKAMFDSGAGSVSEPDAGGAADDDDPFA